MLTLRLVEGERSLIEKSTSALGVVYNTGHHGMSSCWNRENGLQLFYSGGVPWWTHPIFARLQYNGHSGANRSTCSGPRKAVNTLMQDVMREW